MKFILGKKIEMSQEFLTNGTVVPVTLVAAGPCVVTQVKTKEKDGYSAVQLGCGQKKKITKPLAGHLRDLGNFRYLQEWRMLSDEEKLQKNQDEEGLPQRGDKVVVSIFQPGEHVSVIGQAKGRGFAGVVKRHGFHGSPASHGHKDQLRMPGSIGATAPQRVWKGKRMAGRMGGQQVTVKNLEIIAVDKENNLLKIKGAVPGARNSLLLIVGSEK